MVITRLESGARMSQAVIHGNTVYLAGQVGAPGKSIADQTKAVLKQIDVLLAQSGSDKSHLLTVTIWLADMLDFAAMNGVWDEWISGVAAPARATGEVKLASADYKIEVIVTAAMAEIGNPAA